MHTAEQFLEALPTVCSTERIPKIQSYFKGPENDCLGAKMGDLFKLAKAHMEMSVEEINKLLDNKYYEARMGAVCIMDFQARSKKTSEIQHKALFDLYLNRHDRINNWDLVDRSAPYVVGGYLFDKPRDILYRLAKLGNIWERRTAIVSTYFFIRQNDLEDTFKIAEILLHDTEEYIQKAIGSWLREAGKKDEARLRTFLDRHVGSVHRIALRIATEKLDPDSRKRYLAA